MKLFVPSCWSSAALQVLRQPITEGAGCRGDDHVVVSVPDYSAADPRPPPPLPPALFPPFTPLYSFVPVLLLHQLPPFLPSFVLHFPP